MNLEFTPGKRQAFTRRGPQHFIGRRITPSHLADFGMRRRDRNARIFSPGTKSLAKKGWSVPRACAGGKYGGQPGLEPRPQRYIWSERQTPRASTVMPAAVPCRWSAPGG